MANITLKNTTDENKPTRLPNGETVQVPPKGVFELPQEQADWLVAYHEGDIVVVDATKNVEPTEPVVKKTRSKKTKK